VIKTYNILVIEDNEADFTLLNKALRKIQGVKLDITNVTNGQDGIDYVYKQGKFAQAATPDLIILDLNLPIKNGFEVLNTVKKDSILKTIPIVICTTSDAQKDILACYDLYANSYITKGFDLKDIFQKIGNLGEFWFKTAQMPAN